MKPENSTDALPHACSETDELRIVVDKIECFLTGQVDRLERQLVETATLQKCQDTGDIDLLLSQFEVAKVDWQQKYETQRVELEEDCQRLAEAWERVENEQRQMLAAKSIQQTVGGSSKITSREASSDIRHKTPTSLTPLTTAGRESPSPRDPASLTFKQLQQQIRQHNKRRH